MATITKDEYMERLLGYVKSELMSLSEENKPKGLRANVQFNKDKAREFADILVAEGTTVE